MRATSYDGPTEIVTLRVGGRDIRLARPADPDRLLSDPAILAENRVDDYMPYWAYLWPGAFLLAEAVATTRWESGTKALEIGCGLGLAGLSGVAAGLDVAFTDYDDAPFRFIAASAKASGFGADRWSTQTLDWTRPPSERYPVILGADVLYERRLVPLVVGVIRAMLEPGGVALVAGPYRVATEDLAGVLEGTGLKAESSAITAVDDRGREVRGTLHRLFR